MKPDTFSSDRCANLTLHIQERPGQPPRLWYTRPLATKEILHKEVTPEAYDFTPCCCDEAACLRSLIAKLRKANRHHAANLLYYVILHGHPIPSPEPYVDPAFLASGQILPP